MVVGFRSVDVHRVSPSGDVVIILADETVAVPAGAAFLDGFVLVTKEQIGWAGLIFAHCFLRGVRWSRSQPARSAISWVVKL